ncbi:putative leader peptide [Streptomyces werraensis]
MVRPPAPAAPHPRPPPRTRRVPRVPGADAGAPAPRRRPHRGDRLNPVAAPWCTPVMTDTRVRLWRRVHMDLVRYAGCVCRPSC